MMEICSVCENAEPMHWDRDMIECYCEDCFKDLDPEFIKVNGVT